MSLSRYIYKTILDPKFSEQCKRGDRKIVKLDDQGAYY